MTTANLTVSGSPLKSTAFAAPSTPTFVDDFAFTLGNSYPNTGGTVGFPGLPALLSAACGAPRTIVDFLGMADPSGYVLVWDQDRQTVRVFTGAAAASPLTEVVNAVDLSGVSVRVRILSQ